MAACYSSEDAFCVDEEYCVICQKGFETEKSIKVSEKGLLSLILYSEKRGKLNLHKYLKECMSVVPKRKVLVHGKCRRDFTDAKRVIPRAPSPIPSEPTAKRLRSDSLPFNWKGHCMLCGKSAAIDNRHPERSQVCPVRTLPVRMRILEQCTKRADPWALEVQGRLESCIDLVAMEASYHNNCFSRFMLCKEKGTTSAVKTQGRPSNQVMQKCFEMLCQW